MKTGKQPRWAALLVTCLLAIGWLPAVAAAGDQPDSHTDQESHQGRSNRKHRPPDGQSLTFAGNAQHTGVYSVAAQHLNLIHWSTSIDPNFAYRYSHYGAPLITSANTVLAPIVRTGFGVKAFDGATGRLKYNLTNDYQLPRFNTLPVYQAVIALPPSGPRLYYAGAGGTVRWVDNLDSDAPGVPTQLCFYTDLANYRTNAAAFNKSVFINTPLTADENGVIFFGFRLQGTAPAPLGTNSSGFARIEPAGSAAYVLTTAAAGDPRASSEPHNCAPALSNDGATLYVVVFGGTTPYLLGLDSTNLATKYKVQLRDPRGHYPAVVWDDSTASPMVAPDGDVFFGVDATPYNGRGFMLHFSPDLQTLYPPGAFGFDNTASIVPAHLVPSYSGSSTYLLLTKYNNYVGGDGNGVNRMALLDPKATQIDPHPSADGLVEMREVLTVIGCTPDTAYRSSIAVREWCVNSVAVNPPTRSVFVPSEDGRIYRWDLAANSLAETLPLGPGVGEPYVPVVIGPDGTVYTLNGSTLSAVGSPTNVSFALYSSAPDVTRGVVGQPVTFTAVVREPEHCRATPSGSVTFQDVTYNGFVRVTNLLAAALPLSDGRASVTTSSLTAVSNYLGCHFITATYSGDATFPPGSITLVQKVHQYGTTTTLTSYPNPGSNSVTLEAKVVSNPPGGGIPTGQVAFWDHKTFLNQVPLTNGTAAFTTTDLAVGRHALTARYASDSYFAASSAGMSRTPPFLGWPTQLRDGTFQFGFSNSAGLPFTVLSSSDPTLPLSNWTELGPATETFPGQFQFIDPNATNNQQQFYRVRSR